MARERLCRAGELVDGSAVSFDEADELVQAFERSRRAFPVLLNRLVEPGDHPRDLRQAFDLLLTHCGLRFERVANPQGQGREAVRERLDRSPATGEELDGGEAL